MNRMLTTALSLALLAAAPLASADEATITVEGRVLPGTCTLADAPITLEDIEANEMVAGGLLKARPSALQFTGCAGISSIDLSFEGTADAAQDGNWQNDAASGASGVAVALLWGASGETDAAYIKKASGNTRTVAGVTGATASAPLRAGYYHKNGTPFNAGAVSATITVTAAYK